MTSGAQRRRSFNPRSGRTLMTAAVALTVVACGNTSIPSAPERSNAAAALSAAIPALSDAGVANYRNLGWCRNINYRRGAFSDNSDDSACNLFSGPASSFDATATSDFEAVRAALEQSGIKVLGVDLFDVAGASGARMIFDVAGGSSERWSYVYEPGYTLPKDTPTEWVATPIDKDWYFVWQDTN